MASRSSQFIRRPPTPKDDQFDSPPTGAPPPPPLPQNIPTRNSTISAPAPQKRSLAFLRRSRSGDPMRKPTPVVAPQPPALPNLFVNGQNANPSLSKELFGKDIRDSVDIVANKSHSQGTPRGLQQHQGGPYVTGSKSTESVVGSDSHYVTSSQVSLSEDPYAQAGGITNRGRYSFAGSHMSTVNSPRRVRRRRDPTPFNILIIGARNSGKTSFLRFLRQSLAIKSKRGQVINEADADIQHTDHTGTTSDSPFKSTYIETEIDGERIGLTLWDSAGLERNIIDLQIRETVAFIENKFEETFSEETKVVRAPGSRDTHIHVVFLLLDPARLTPDNHYPGKSSTDKSSDGLDNDLDIQVFTALQGKTVVVPVISKADTCTSKHMEHLKQQVRSGLQRAGLDPLQALELDDEEYDDEEDETSNETPRASMANPNSYYDEDEVDSSGSEDSSHQINHRSNRDRNVSQSSAFGKGQRKTSSSGAPPMSAGLNFIPLSIISPDSYEPGEKVGRSFPWGFADPYDESHCDFVKLKEYVFSEWRQELRDKSRIQWYESWRSERLASVRGSRLY